MPFPTGERRVGALRMLELAPVRVTLYNAVSISFFTLYFALPTTLSRSSSFMHQYL